MVGAVVEVVVEEWVVCVSGYIFTQLSCPKIISKSCHEVQVAKCTILLFYTISLFAKRQKMYSCPNTVARKVLVALYEIHYTYLTHTYNCCT